MERRTRTRILPSLCISGRILDEVQSTRVRALSPRFAIERQKRTRLHVRPQPFLQDLLSLRIDPQGSRTSGLPLEVETANFCTARSFPLPLPSYRVVTVTFETALEEGR
jgi:hypothetical protein